LIDVGQIIADDLGSRIRHAVWENLSGEIEAATGECIGSIEVDVAALPAPEATT
jgi:hypothetical protein